MNELQVYNVLENWKSKTYLESEELVFNSKIYTGAIKTFFTDYRRWFPDDKTIELSNLLMTPQLHSLLTYRLAHLFYKNNDEATAQILSQLGRINGQIEIYYSSQIGDSFKVNHGIGSVIGARCVIGSNCTIHQNVTLGDKNGGRPVLGNNVVIYPGAIIIGAVNIGNHSTIGANSLVMDSFGENSIIVGSPAKKIK